MDRTELLAMYASLLINGHSVDQSRAAHQLLDTGMTEEQIVKFERRIRLAAHEGSH